MHIETVDSYGNSIRRKPSGDEKTVDIQSEMILFVFHSSQTTVEKHPPQHNCGIYGILDICIHYMRTSGKSDLVHSNGRKECNCRIILSFRLIHRDILQDIPVIFIFTELMGENARPVHTGFTDMNPPEKRRNIVYGQ